jgi:cytoskeletal protein CcmA (bactofilin family)
MFSWTRTQLPAGGSRPSAPQPKPAEPVAAQAAPEAKPAEVDGPAPTRRFTDAVPPCATRLGRLHIRGTLTGSDSVELSGTFDGPITVDGLCHVQEGGRVTGELTAGDGVIAGEVRGRLTVIRRLEMSAHARVLADVEAGTIAIAEGCFIEGRIHMRGSVGGSQPMSFKEKRRGRKRSARPPGARGG